MHHDPDLGLNSADKSLHGDQRPILGRRFSFSILLKQVSFLPRCHSGPLCATVALKLPADFPVFAFHLTKEVLHTCALEHLAFYMGSNTELKPSGLHGKLFHLQSPLAKFLFNAPRIPSEDPIYTTWGGAAGSGANWRAPGSPFGVQAMYQHLCFPSSYTGCLLTGKEKPQVLAPSGKGFLNTECLNLRPSPD